MKKALILTLFILLVCFVCNECFAKTIDYKVRRRDDGGYAIDIKCTVQHWEPVTAEGFFPNEVTEMTVELIGKGADCSHQNQNGYYYERKDIRGVLGEIGYAWIDKKHEYIYINLFWVTSPDKLTPSVINGKYRILSK